MLKEQAVGLLERHPDRAQNLIVAACDLSSRPLDRATRSWVTAILAFQPAGGDPADLDQPASRGAAVGRR